MQLPRTSFQELLFKNFFSRTSFNCYNLIWEVELTLIFIFQEVEITLFHLPKPTKHHLDTLEQLLTKIEKEVSLSTPDMQARAAIAAQLDLILAKFIPGNCFIFTS